MTAGAAAATAAAMASPKKKARTGNARSAARLAAVQALYQQEMEGHAAGLAPRIPPSPAGRDDRRRRIRRGRGRFLRRFGERRQRPRRRAGRLIAGKLRTGWTLDRLDRPMRRSSAPAPTSWSPAPDVPAASVSTNMSTSPRPSTTPARPGFVNGLLDAVARIAAGARARPHRSPAALATDPAARASPTTRRSEARRRDWSLTHDTIVEGVHFLPDDPPGDVAWKLVAVNLSDLAAKGARRGGAARAYARRRDEDGTAFPRRASAAALDAFGVRAARRRHGRAARAPRDARPHRDRPRRPGRAPRGPARGRATAVGDAARSAMRARAWRSRAASAAARRALLDRYRRPSRGSSPGRALAPHVHAMMDVSDGLLIDAARMAAASGLARRDRPRAIPLSDAIAPCRRRAPSRRRPRATIMNCCSPPPAPADAAPARAAATRIGRFAAGAASRSTDGGTPVPLPARLGFQH